MNIIPAIIRTGESYRIEVVLPTQPEADEPWTRVDLRLRRAKDTENTVFAVDSTTIEQNMAELDITSTSTEQWADNIYRFSLTCSTADGFTKIIESGVVDVQNPLDPKLTFNERMVMLLESIIEDKAAGRGDVRRYEIADRSTESMSYRELIVALSDFKEAVALERGKGVRKVRV